MNDRYKHARGPETEKLKEELLCRIRSCRTNSAQEVLAEDVIEAILEARSNTKGMRAAKERFCELGKGGDESYE